MAAINPNTFKALDTKDLLTRAAELQRLDPNTANLLRVAVLEIDSLRDACLETHGVTVIERPHDVATDDAVEVKVSIIEARADPVYGHTFKLPSFLPAARELGR